VCVVCEGFVILNPYIYLAVGAAPQRKRGYLFLSRIRGLAIRGVAETEGRAAARRYSATARQ